MNIASGLKAYACILVICVSFIAKKKSKRKLCNKIIVYIKISYYIITYRYGCD